MLFPLFPPFAYIAPPAALLPWKLLCPFDCGAAGMWIGPTAPASPPIAPSPDAPPNKSSNAWPSAGSSLRLRAWMVAERPLE